MIFARLWVLNLLWVLPFIVFVFIIAARKRDQGLERFADRDLLDRLCLLQTRPARVVWTSFLIVSMALMIFSLAGPRWGERFQEVTQRGVDIMVCMDVSSSMLVEDIKPNRLESAKREVIDLINIIEGDRLGLVAFAGDAFLQCPLTLDYNALLMFLDQVSPDLIPVYGTDLGKAIDTASDSFDEKGLSDKVILLITDGEDNEGEGFVAAKRAGELGIRIFVFGLGDPSGGPVPQMEEEGFEKDDQGRLVLSKLDEKTLKDIASVSGGVYVRSIQGDLDLDRIYFDGIRKRTEAGVLKSGKIRVFEERFYLFLFAAMVLLLLEGFLSERLFRTGMRSFLLFLMLWGQASLIFAQTDGEELYKQGRFKEALEVFTKEDMDHPKDVRFRYNRGCAAFQDGDIDGSEAAFTSVLRRSGDDNIRFRALYNRGAASFKKGDFAKAAIDFKEALKIKRDDEDARFNFELSLLRKRQAEEEDKKRKEEKNGQDQPDHKDDNGKKDEERAEKSQKTPEGENNSQKDQTDTGNQDKEGEGREEQREERAKTEQEVPSGELEGKDMNATGGEEKKQSPPQNDTQMARNRAEALLENIKDDPSIVLKGQKGQRKLKGGSGKRW